MGLRGVTASGHCQRWLKSHKKCLRLIGVIRVSRFLIVFDGLHRSTSTIVVDGGQRMLNEASGACYY